MIHHVLSLLPYVLAIIFGILATELGLMLWRYYHPPLLPWAGRKIYRSPRNLGVGIGFNVNDASIRYDANGKRAGIDIQSATLTEMSVVDVPEEHWLPGPKPRRTAYGVHEIVMGDPGYPGAAHDVADEQGDVFSPEAIQSLKEQAGLRPGDEGYTPLPTIDTVGGPLPITVIHEDFQRPK